MRLDAYLTTVHQAQPQVISLPVYTTPTAITLQIIRSQQPMATYFEWVAASFGQERLQKHQQEINHLLSAHPEKQLRLAVM